jgi:transposase-like protein
VIFIDAIHVKVRDGQVADRPIYVALAVTVDGGRDIEHVEQRVIKWFDKKGLLKPGNRLLLQ